MASTQSQTQAARAADPAAAHGGRAGDARAVRMLERLRRAPLRASRSRPSAAVARATGPCGSARNPAQARRAACKAVERRALSPSAAQGGPNGLEGTQVPSGSFRRSTGLTAGKICSNRAQKGTNAPDSGISAWSGVGRVWGNVRRRQCVAHPAGVLFFPERGGRHRSAGRSRRLRPSCLPTLFLCLSD